MAETWTNQKSLDWTFPPGQLQRIVNGMILRKTDDQRDELSSPDERLVEFTARGCDAAFAVLVSRHGDAVYTIVRNMCRTPSEAAELAYQTFIDAYREIASMRPGTSFPVWLCGVALNKALLARRRGMGIAASPLGQLPTSDDGHLMPVGWKRPDLTDLASERGDLAGLLREALERVDDGARAAFVLCDLAELPAMEAAALLQTSPREIRQRVHRTRLMLINVLPPNDHD